MYLFIFYLFIYLFYLFIVINLIFMYLIVTIFAIIAIFKYLICCLIYQSVNLIVSWYISLNSYYFNKTLFSISLVSNVPWCLRWGQLSFFVVWTVKIIFLSQVIGKIIVILSLRVATSKYQNIDYQGKETCAYESSHISLLHDSTMSGTVNVCFLSILLQPKRKRY